MKAASKQQHGAARAAPPSAPAASAQVGSSTASGSAAAASSSASAAAAPVADAGVQYHFVPVPQVLDGRDRIEYILTVREQPKQSRMCGSGEKADRRPVDPAPIVQLRVITHEIPRPGGSTGVPPHATIAAANLPAGLPIPRRKKTIPLATHPIRSGVPVTTSWGPGWEDKAWFLENPYYFMYAMLADADTDAELLVLSDGRTRSTTGSCVSCLYHLKDVKDNSDQGFFVFPDLSIRSEGRYRLKLSLFETIGNEVHHCKSIYTAPFVVHSAKGFPGMNESTVLARSFASQGMKLRVRRHPRGRKNTITSQTYDSEEEDEAEQVRGPASKRIRSDSHASYHQQAAPSGSGGGGMASAASASYQTSPSQGTYPQQQQQQQQQQHYYALPPPPQQQYQQQQQQQHYYPPPPLQAPQSHQQQHPYHPQPPPPPPPPAAQQQQQQQQYQHQQYQYHPGAGPPPLPPPASARPGTEEGWNRSPSQSTHWKGKARENSGGGGGGAGYHSTSASGVSGGVGGGGGGGSSGVPSVASFTPPVFAFGDRSRTASAGAAVSGNGGGAGVVGLGVGGLDRPTLPPLWSLTQGHHSTGGGTGVGVGVSAGPAVAGGTRVVTPSAGRHPPFGSGPISGGAGGGSGGAGGAKSGSMSAPTTSWGRRGEEYGSSGAAGSFVQPPPPFEGSHHGHYTSSSSASAAAYQQGSPTSHQHQQQQQQHHHYQPQHQYSHQQQHQHHQHQQQQYQHANAHSHPQHSQPHARGYSHTQASDTPRWAGHGQTHAHGHGHGDGEDEWDGPA
ncbi:hypothetical protein A4X06_0g5913 [Tilletia controversa]|uniref:Velvet domain-containing protein n=1 Tax=Tilletia controversa TaxID=13291 RepID=A0A8X7MR54_9BASI|nr:hypothetical protein CF328_g4657 [Tilletia controversa]KAE8244896.1 hypothetical protein A4X06_0g5913 [Tilletia controversa]CAD6975498.1 unnamed protein product [Tilletia controversa]